MSSVCTLNKISNWSLFKLIISDQALITLKCFLPMNVQFNGQTFSGFSDKHACLSIHGLFWLKMQKICFF